MYSEMIEEFLFFIDSYEAAIRKCTVAEETSNVDETGNDTDNGEHAWEQMKLSRRVRAKEKGHLTKKMIHNSENYHKNIRRFRPFSRNLQKFHRTTKQAR